MIVIEGEPMGNGEIATFTDEERYWESRNEAEHEEADQDEDPASEE